MADLDVDAVISGAATAKKKKKKSSVPLVKVTEPEVEHIVKKYIKTSEEMATLKAVLQDTADEIIPYARRRHKEVVTSEAKLHTTIKLQTADSKSISVDVAKNQYGKVDIDEEPDLKETFGDKYEQYFVKELNISLTRDAMKDKKVLAKLIKAVGQENFDKYFEVSHYLKPTEKFHQDRFLDEDASEKIDEVISEEIVKPYKPAIRA